VGSLDLYPFGIEMASDWPELPAESRMRYTVHERDAATGADYMMARYKTASGSGFASPDILYDVSFSRPTTWNKYAYVGGNPTRRLDPTGLRFVLEVNCETNWNDAECAGPSGWMGYSSNFFDQYWMENSSLARQRDGYVSYVSRETSGCEIGSSWAWTDPSGNTHPGGSGAIACLDNWVLGAEAIERVNRPTMLEITRYTQKSIVELMGDKSLYAVRRQMRRNLQDLWQVSRGVSKATKAVPVVAAIVGALDVYSNVQAGDSLGVASARVGIETSSSVALGGAGIGLGSLTGPAAPVAVPVLGVLGFVGGSYLGEAAGNYLFGAHRGE